MLPGDILYKVKDILVSGEDLNLLISEHIKGEEGTTVPIEVYRAVLPTNTSRWMWSAGWWKI